MRKAARFAIHPTDDVGGKILESISGQDKLSSKLSTEWVPLRTLQVDPENPRTLNLDSKRLLADPEASDDELERTMLRELRALADSIRQDGLSNPIEVYPLPGDAYRIISGERRYWACQYNWMTADPESREGLSEVRVTIYKTRPQRLRRKQLTENVLRADLPLIDLMHSIKAAYEELKAEGQVIDSALQLAQHISLPYHDARVWFPVLTKWPSIVSSIAAGHFGAIHQIRMLLSLDEALVNKALPKIAQYGFSEDLIDSLKEGKVAPAPEKAKKKPHGGRPAKFVYKAGITPVAAQKIYDALAPTLNLANVDWADHKASKKAFEALLAALNA